MSNLDFFVFSSILLFIALYGAIKNYQNKNLKSYILGDNSVKWSTIGLSVMATQASAITFLSTPGQGYKEGMSFIQIYLGLPLALIVVSAVFVPIYYKSKVFTAYQYLEERFDVKVRALTSFFFLLQRGLQCGITIYAPSIILTTILGWDMTPTVIFVGLLVISYTVIGGSKAVSYTHKYQMILILSGLVIVFFYLLSYINEYLSINESFNLIKVFDKNNAISFSTDIEEKYTLWTGLLGGFFLSLSYFGTDQSQVSRYINAKNIEESRIGLIFNAILKIPLQFFILLIGTLLFVFYSLYQPPINFNDNLVLYQKENNFELYDNTKKEANNLFQEKKNLIVNSLKNNEFDVHNKRSEEWKVTLLDTGEDSMTGGRLSYVKNYVKDDDIFLIKNNFGVNKELLIEENNKFYEVMVVSLSFLPELDEIGSKQFDLKDESHLSYLQSKMEHYKLKSRKDIIFKKTVERYKSLFEV